MFIRSILTIAVLASFVFGAAANATEINQTARTQTDVTAQMDGFASAGGLGSTRR